MSFSHRIFELAQYLFLTSYYYEPGPVSSRVENCKALINLFPQMIIIQRTNLTDWMPA